MKHLKSYKEMNESLTSILLAAGAIWCLWKFLKGWAKSKMEEKPPLDDESANKVKELIDILQKLKKDERGEIKVEEDKEWITFYIENKKLLINKKDKTLNWPGMDKILVTQGFIDQLKKEIETDIEKYKKIQ